MKNMLNFEHFWKCTSEMYLRFRAASFQISKYATAIQCHTFTFTGPQTPGLMVRRLLYIQSLLIRYGANDE